MGPSLPTTAQTPNPRTPTKANTVSAAFQSHISASGAAPATEAATPKLTIAVLRELITSTSRGGNHCINNGPVAVTIKASPTP